MSSSSESASDLSHPCDDEHCPPSTLLEQFARGELEPDRLALVDERLDRCDGCRHRLSKFLAAADLIPSSVSTPHELAAPSPDERGPDERGPDERAPDDRAPDDRARQDGAALDGQIIADRYRLVRAIGGGGMGTVYEAEHVLIGRRVALKLLHGRYADNREVVHRFQNEARAAASLGHPAILQPLDMGRSADGRPFLVLELLEGRDLGAELATRGALPIAEAVGYARQIADAVGAAHALGIVHRDLKPENVFLTRDGRLKVLDFGISKIASSVLSSPATAPGMLIGTPQYMAPELFEDARNATPRSDVYGLAVILFRALTGRFPHRADSMAGLLLAIVSSQGVSARAFDSAIPHALDDVLLRALAVDPEVRFQSMADFAGALAPFERARDHVAAIDGLRPYEPRVATVMVATGVSDQLRAARIITAHGGSVVPTGQAVVGAFGAGTWRGDDGLRAVRAGLEIRSFATAVAIATGHVVLAGEVGEAGAIAEALAACSIEAETQAPLEGVAILPPVPRGVESELNVREVRRGRFQALPRDVGGAPSASSELGPEPFPMVGRATELAQIEAAIDRALDERVASTLLVTGPPGIGKSRLAIEARRRLDRGGRGVTILSSTASPVASRRLALLADAVASHAQRAAPASVDPAQPLEARRAAVVALCRAATRADDETRLDVRAPGDALAPGDATPRSDSAFDTMATFLGELLDVPMPTSSTLSAARGDPRLMADRLRLALVEYIEGLVTRRPLAIVVEDLQWADAESLDVLREITDLCREAPLVLLGTARAELGAPPPVPFDGPEAIELKLRGLGTAEATSLAQVVTGRRVGSDLIQALLRRTDGNPFFLEQILRALVEEGALEVAVSEERVPQDRAADEEGARQAATPEGRVSGEQGAPEEDRAAEERAPEMAALGAETTGGLAELPLPLDVEGAVQARLDGLPTNERHAIQCAAVIGRPFRAEVTWGLEVDDASVVLASLVRRGLLRRRSVRPRLFPSTDAAVSFEFRASLVADVAYRLSTEEARRALHLRVAAVLSREETDPETLAWHFDRGGAAAEAAAHYVTATLAAARREDSATVLRCSSRALALGTPEEALFVIRAARAEALSVQGQLDAQDLEIEAAMAIAKTREERTWAYSERAQWLMRTRSPSEALPWHERAVEAAEGDDTALAQALGRHATGLVYVGRLDEAAGVLAEAERLVMTRAPTLRAEAAAWRAQLAGAQGDLGARRAAYAAAVELYRDAGDLRRFASASVNLADVYNRFGAYLEAEAALIEAVARCRRLGMRLVEGYALANLGYARVMAGKLDEARPAIERAVQMAMAIGDSRLVVFTLLYRSRLRHAMGDAEGARAAAREAAASAEAAEMEAPSILALTLEAKAAISLGDVVSAESLTRRAIARHAMLGAVEEDDGEIYLTWMETLERTGHQAEAESIRQQGRARVRAVAQRIGSPAWRERYLTDVASNRRLLA
jgi:predicted ATPase/tRNA A-37 threonylcarbamoyl transferase component Bud32